MIRRAILVTLGNKCAIYLYINTHREEKLEHKSNFDCLSSFNQKSYAQQCNN